MYLSPYDLKRFQRVWTQFTGRAEFISSLRVFVSQKKLGIGGGIGPTPPHTLVTKVTAIGEFHPLIYCDKIFLYTNFNTYPCFITLLGMCSSLSYLFEFNGLNELSNYNLLCQKLNELYICFTTKGEEKQSFGMNKFLHYYRFWEFPQFYCDKVFFVY